MGSDIAFVQDVAKENDGVNYLPVVIDVFPKFLCIRPMKNKSARSLVQAFDSMLQLGTQVRKCLQFE